MKEKGSALLAIILVVVLAVIVMFILLRFLKSPANIQTQNPVGFGII